MPLIRKQMPVGIASAAPAPPIHDPNISPLHSACIPSAASASPIHGIQYRIDSPGASNPRPRHKSTP
eukprot:jgi/Psemu1/16400/gm1.16400_g